MFLNITCTKNDFLFHVHTRTSEWQFAANLKKKLSTSPSYFKFTDIYMENDVEIRCSAAWQLLCIQMPFNGVQREREKNTPLKFFNYVNGAKSIEQRQLLHWFPATLVHNTPPTEHLAKLPSRRAPQLYVFLTTNVSKLEMGQRSRPVFSSLQQTIIHLYVCVRGIKNHFLCM